MALSEAKKIRHREYMRLRYQNDPVHKAKQKARVAVGHAIRDGKLTQLPCEVCGEVKSSAVHEDFEQPLKVKWLCKAHRPSQKPPQ